MKKIIQLLSVCLLSLAAVSCNSSLPPVFQIRLVVDAPSGESEDMVVVDKTRAADQKETLHVLKTVLIDQTAVESAKVTKDKQFGDPQIEIRFTKDGKQRVAEVTRARVGKRLAFVIDGQLYSAPKVYEEITSGTARIGGSFSEQEAEELAGRITDSLKK